MVKLFCETQQLILRELLPTDTPGMLELDSDPDVLRLLNVKPFEHIKLSEEIIEMGREKYLDNGIGRWATFEKSTNEFLGWATKKSPGQ